MASTYNKTLAITILLTASALPFTASAMGLYFPSCNPTTVPNKPITSSSWYEGRFHHYDSASNLNFYRVYKMPGSTTPVPSNWYHSDNWASCIPR